MPTFDDTDINVIDKLCREQFNNLCPNQTQSSDAMNASTAEVPLDLSGKDASWILTSAVIIFTMQTGK